MAICKNCKYQYDGNFCPQCGAANDVNIPLTFLQEQEQTHSREFSEQSSIPVAPVKTEKKEKAHALLGFRTNKVWKKILSILYIIFCLIMFISLFDVSQDKHLSFRDIVVDKIGDIVFLFSIISPYIFLSNTKIRNKLPLFKNHKASLSFVGMLIVWTLCIVIGMSVDNFHSQQYEFDKENHSFTVIETVDPNCIDVGKIKKECDICKKIEVDEVAALGHDFSNGEKCLRCGKTKNELTQAATTKATKAQKTEKATQKQTDKKHKFFNSEKLNESFISACEECNINIDEVKQVVQTEDGVAGPRYYFYYNYEKYIVYCTMEERVKSITKNLVKIYENTEELQASQGKYRMVYDQKGSTGKEIILDGNSYYNYYVPTGKYRVTNRSKTSMFYIASDKYYTNLDGYQENDILKTINMSKYMETTVIEISEGYHIELVHGSDIELEKIG